MPLMLLSNPGLPLAVYGNPGGRRKGTRMRRRNPHYRAELSQANGATRSYSLNTINKAHFVDQIKRDFPGWSIDSVSESAAKNDMAAIFAAGGSPAASHVVSAKGTRGKKYRIGHRRLMRARKVSPFDDDRMQGGKAPKQTGMGAILAAAGSTSTATGTSMRTKRKYHRRTKFYKTIARRSVGKTRRSHGNWVRILRAHVRRRSGRRIHHPAIPWSGRRGKITYFGIGTRRGRKGFRAVRFTNPHRRGKRRARRNPGALAGYVGGLTAAPMRVLNVAKSMSPKAIGYLAGGTVVSYLAGGVVAAYLVKPLLAKLPLGNLVAPGSVGSRVVGAALPYSAAFVASRFVRDPGLRGALMLGGALASIVELLMPGKVGQLVAKIPGADKLPQPVLNGLSGPLAGLEGYVEAPAYAGTGAYVEAPAYAGTGDDPAMAGSDALAGYVAAPGYQGTGEQLAADFLDTNYLTNNYLEASAN